MNSITKTFYGLSETSVTILCVLFGSLFLAVSAQVAFPLPYTPIPVTLQTFAICLLSAVLGSKRAFYAVVAYLIEGTLGLPVFAGFQIDPLWFVSMRGGYLIGFAVAAFAMGKLLEIGQRNHFGYSMFVFFLGHGLVLAFGALWLSFLLGGSNAFWMGIVPFVPGTILKTLAASCVFQGYDRKK